MPEHDRGQRYVRLIMTAKQCDVQVADTEHASSNQRGQRHVMLVMAAKQCEVDDDGQTKRLCLADVFLMTPGRLHVRVSRQWAQLVVVDGSGVLVLLKW